MPAFKWYIQILWPSMDIEMRAFSQILIWGLWLFTNSSAFCPYIYYIAISFSFVNQKVYEISKKYFLWLLLSFSWRIGWEIKKTIKNSKSLAGIWTHTLAERLHRTKSWKKATLWNVELFRYDFILSTYINCFGNNCELNKCSWTNLPYF